MTVNKNALIRYQALDRCFRNSGRMYFIDDLLEECNNALIEFDANSNGIQRRQLFDDIRFMESEAGWAVPLAKIRFGKKVYYRYEDLTFSINSQPLNDSEAEQIKSALHILSRFSGTPQFGWVNELITKLDSKFGLVDREKEVISFNSNLDLKGLQLLMPLFNAVVNKRVINIIYQDFKSAEPYEITFHPYYLKEFNDRWFLLGMNAENQIPTWNLALDRIESFSETDLKYQETDIDWEDYFFDLVGVTRPVDGKVQEVVLHFASDIAPYIKTKPIHPSQKHKDLEDYLEVKISVIPNLELERLIISFAEGVKVVLPPDFKQRIVQRIRNAGAQY